MAYMCLHGYGECDGCGRCGDEEVDIDEEDVYEYNEEEE